MNKRKEDHTHIQVIASALNIKVESLGRRVVPVGQVGEDLRLFAT